MGFIVSVARDSCIAAAAVPKPQSEQIRVYCQFCFRTSQRPCQRDGVHCPVNCTVPDHNVLADVRGGGGHEVCGPPREGISTVAHSMPLLMTDTDPMVMLPCDQGGAVVELDAIYWLRVPSAYRNDRTWITPLVEYHLAGLNVLEDNPPLRSRNGGVCG